jgi:hypothetical protein
VGSPDSLLDFGRVDSVPVDMADIVQIPIEAFQAVEHTLVYTDYVYTKSVDTPYFSGLGPHSSTCDNLTSGLARGA